MKLTVFADYGLRTLMYLSRHRDRMCTAREIAQGYGISLNHIVKVVHRLSQLGYIEGIKGKGGGIRLRGEPESMNLWAVIRDIEPDFALVECFDKTHNACRVVEACGLSRLLAQAMKAFADTLAQYTVADTIARPRLFSSLVASGGTNITQGK